MDANVSQTPEFADPMVTSHFAVWGFDSMFLWFYTE